MYMSTAAIQHNTVVTTELYSAGDPDLPIWQLSAVCSRGASTTTGWIISTKVLF